MTASAKTKVAMILAIVAVAMIGGQASAQHLISSKAGFVNRVDGKVYILRADSLDGERGRASLGTQMRDGDLLMTETESKAEVLLNPGSYLRMDGKTEIIARGTALDEVRFELKSGTIIVEISEIDKKMPIEIITANGSVYARKMGLYRFEALAGSTRVAVRQGELILGSRDLALANKGYKIKKGNIASLTGNDPTLAKLDRDAIDEFDVWSFNRAQALVAANHSALRASRTYGSLAYGWIFDPIFGTYTFIPRNGLIWSPYGFGFFNSFGNCWTCFGWSPYGWGYNPYGRPNGNSGGMGGGGGTTGLPPRVIAGNDRAPIQRSMEGRRIDSSGLFDSRADGFGGASRGISMPSTSSATSVIAAPAPSRSTGAAPAASSGGGGRPSMPSRP